MEYFVDIMWLKYLQYNQLGENKMKIKRLVFLTATMLFLSSTLYQINGETVNEVKDQSVVTEGQQSSEKIFTSELLRKEVVTALNSEGNRIEGSVWEKKI